MRLRSLLFAATLYVATLSLALATSTIAAVDQSPATAAKTVKVKVVDNAFSKKKLTVKRGTKVKWVWSNTQHPHNVTVVSGPRKFSSKTQTKGSFTKKLTKKGTYKIVCTLHSSVMKMTIKVK